MKAKEFLSRYSSCERRIEVKEEKIRELKDRAVSISISFREKVQTNKQIHGTEKIISLYMDMQTKLEEEILELSKIATQIAKVVEKIDDDDQKEILERRYINRQGFPKISEEMYISERQIFRIHGKALEKVDEYLKKTKVWGTIFTLTNKGRN